jgi:hypothetical protein
LYDITIWKNHVTDPSDLYNIVNADTKEKVQAYLSLAGTVMQQGTPQDGTHFNNMEAGILDAHVAACLAFNAMRQNDEQVGQRFEQIGKKWQVESGTVTLTNTQAFPFNNSKKTVSLAELNGVSPDYVVVAQVIAGVGNVGEIEISDKLANGFKIAYTGSATTVTIAYTVIGGNWE